jgi:hypothetical protein
MQRQSSLAQDVIRLYHALAVFKRQHRYQKMDDSLTVHGNPVTMVT